MLGCTVTKTEVSASLEMNTIHSVQLCHCHANSRTKRTNHLIKTFVCLVGVQKKREVGKMTLSPLVSSHLDKIYPKE